jgi:hypothetical protein
MCRIFIKKYFLFTGGKCLLRKAVHNWVEKFSQGRSKVADYVRPGLPVKIATEAIVQRVEELTRADRCITHRINGFSDFVNRPDSKELEDKNTTFRKLDLFSSSGEGRHLLCWVP